MDELSEESIKRGLQTAFVGRNVFYYPLIGSTNDVAKELARNGAPEGTLVIADEQIAGRGRLGRRWLAPPGSSLLMSLIFRPNLPATQAQHLTMACALAVAEAIEEVTGLEVGLKWPNDLLIGGKKVGGILTELRVEGNRLDYAVAGLGLNVNFDPACVPDIPSTATSLMAESGQEISRLELLQRILEKIERRYERLQAGEPFHQEWVERLAILHKEVTVITPQGKSIGRVEGVDADGALILRTANGELRRVLAGDVTLRT